jgi:hypothetical protein
VEKLQPTLRIGSSAPKSCGALPATTTTLARRATRLLDSRLLDYEYRHEYAELARSVLPLLNHGEVQAWESLILGGPLLDQEALEERAARQLQPGEQLDQAVQRYREVWQLNVLSAIGQKSLSDRAGACLAQLVTRYGELPHPDFPSYSSSWSGPDSPVAAEGNWSRRAAMRFWNCCHRGAGGF